MAKNEVGKGPYQTVPFKVTVINKHSLTFCIQLFME